MGLGLLCVVPCAKSTYRPSLSPAHVCSMVSVIVPDAALSVLVYQRTGSPLRAALTFAAAFVPMGIGAVLLGGIGRGRPNCDVLVAGHRPCRASRAMSTSTAVG